MWSYFKGRFGGLTGDTLSLSLSCICILHFAIMLSWNCCVLKLGLVRGNFSWTFFLYGKIEHTSFRDNVIMEAKKDSFAHLYPSLIGSFYVEYFLRRLGTLPTINFAFYTCSSAYRCWAPGLNWSRKRILGDFLMRKALQVCQHKCWET